MNEAVIGSGLDGRIACAFVRAPHDRRYWCGFLYGDFARMQAPGESPVIYAVADDFGNLVRVVPT